MKAAYNSPMAKKGFTDTDKGMKKILEEMKKLGQMHAKVGFPDNGDNAYGVRIAQYAFWNENGVRVKEGKTLRQTGEWAIPPRPFFSQAYDNNQSQIKEAGEKLVKQVANGKIDAKTAMRQIAEGMVTLIQESIKKGNWEENSEITIYGIEGFIRGKESKTPLVNTGMMKGSVMYQIFEDDTKVEEGGKKPG